MGAYNPPLESGLHFSRKDKQGRIARGWLGCMQIDIGYACMLMFADEQGDYYPAPNAIGNPNGGFLRVWDSLNALQQEVNTEYGGMGNFLLGKPGDPARRGIVSEAQPMINYNMDPTPVLPSHTNADPATMQGLCETAAKYLIAPEDPTFTNAPQIQSNPNP